jgi:L-lactate dehydrogenase complex protein LldG
MAERGLSDLFIENARRVGTEIFQPPTVTAALHYIHQRAKGVIVLTPCTSIKKLDLASALRNLGSQVAVKATPTVSTSAFAGLSGANFAIADTGTIVLESTDEATRLATTLPERHFVLLDPRKIVADGLEAVPLVRRLHEQRPRNFLAYISGPSRTADIERVLTIGVHGPCELHVLLLDGISDDPMES